jgi:DNA repair exonuclease SbcCD nuclease subunit
MDSPFDALSDEKAAVRRREQRELLERLTDIVNGENIQLVLLAGDLLDSAASYFETQEVLVRAFTRMRAEIFIAPGNHDYYCAKSPYAYMKLPPNVHLFTSPVLSAVTLPELGCRVWGAGFNDQYSRPLLSGFSAPESDLTDIMVLHGDMAGDAYNHIKEAEIASSGLHYLALGHIHTFSGIKKAGKTTYAYSGCPEGRGFDETGEKGVIVGTVSKSGCDLAFRPLGGRAYKILRVDVTDKPDAYSAVCDALPANTSRDIYRIILCGETDGVPDTASVIGRLTDQFFDLTVTDQTVPRRDIWKDAGDGSLRGIFLSRLREKYDAADEDGRRQIMLAVRYGLAALDNAEEVP